MKKNRLERLCEAIKTSVKESCEEPVTVAFSGGIDSSLVAFLARKFTDVELIAVGTPNSYDLEAATSAAKMIDKVTSLGDKGAYSISTIFPCIFPIIIEEEE